MPAVTPYRATVSRRTGATATGYQEQRPPWGPPVLWDEPCDLQVPTGEIAQHEFGREVQTAPHAFFATGTDIRRGDGVRFTDREDSAGDLVAIDPPLSFEVVGVMDWGAPGDLELELRETQETFEVGT